MKSDHLLEHRHGASPDGTPVSEGVIDFSVNLAPIASPLCQLMPHLSMFSPYPSIDGRRVREFYVSRFDLDLDCVLALNGAIEGIYLLPRVYRLKRVLVLQPSFFDYSRACRLAGAEIVPLLFDSNNGFSFPEIENVIEALNGCDGFFAANPNNPTGTMIPKELLLALASRFPEKRFIVDEAFIQFTEGFPGNSLMQEVLTRRNIMVIHSLTKYYAIAGLRLGAVIAHPTEIEVLYRHKEPWTINAVAEMVAGKLLECGNYDAMVRAVLSQGRRMISDTLRSNPAIELYGGSANFFLAEVKNGRVLNELLVFLKHRGIMVRDCRNFEGLSSQFFRFCIRGPIENQRFLFALNEFGQNGGGADTMHGEVFS